jgi:hypothetical protein
VLWLAVNQVNHYKQVGLIDPIALQGLDAMCHKQPLPQAYLDKYRTIFTQTQAATTADDLSADPQPIPQFRLRRIKQGSETTLSVLERWQPWEDENGNETPNGGYEHLCYCLEDKVRTEKIAAQTAIPTGLYPLRYRKEGRIYNHYVPKFGDLNQARGMIEIAELPNFSYVMFHIGNSKADTAGCPLVGSKVDEAYLQATGDYKVLHSTATYRKVYPLLAAALDTKKPIWLDILNDY